MIHRRCVLKRDFPLLNSSHTSIQQNQIAQQLGILINDNRQSQEFAEGRRTEIKNKPLSQFISERGVAITLRLCNVMSEDQLPPIWKELALAPKAQQLSVLQLALDEKNQATMEPDIQFIASANLLTVMKTLSFKLTSVNSVVSGLNAFLFYEQLEQEAYETSTTWEALIDGTDGATMADLALLLNAKIKPPLNDMDVRHMHRRLEIMCQVLFGDHHVVPLAIGDFLVH